MHGFSVKRTWQAPINIISAVVSWQVSTTDIYIVSDNPDNYGSMRTTVYKPETNVEAQRQCVQVVV
jgi:hypothetical protein